MEVHTLKASHSNSIRNTFYFIGLICFGLGVAFSVKVKYLGFHPWDVLNVALFEHFGFTIGMWRIMVGLVLIGISLLVSKKYVNIVTFINALLIGPIMDFFLQLDILPDANINWTNLLLLLVGMSLTGLGGGLIITGIVGAGPRDGFMLSISGLFRLSVVKARIMVELIVQAI